MRRSRNAVVVLVLAVSSVSCGGGGSGGDPGPDTTPPTVAATNPGNGATSVAKGVAVTATFSEAVDPATLSTITFSLSGSGGAVAGSVGWNAGTRTATFAPTSALAASTQYTARVVGVEDLAGNPMDGAHVWTFETSAPAAGELDPAFGTAGLVRTNVSTPYDFARGLAIQADDKIVVAGGNGAGAFAVVRYDADGTLDPTFGPDGIVTTTFAGCNGFARAVTLQPDGKIVAAGTCGGFSEYDVTLVRYEADGTLDPAFGVGGITLLPRSGAQTADALAIDGGGNIVVAGMSDSNSTATNETDFLVQRLTPAGALDATFSGDGVAYVDFKPASYTSGSPLWDAAYAVTVRADGRILVAGYAENTAWLDDIALALLDADGTLSSKGRHMIGTLKNNSARALAIDPNGGIVVAGMVQNWYFGVLRFTSTQSLDAAFGDGGVAMTDIRNDGTSSEDYAYAVTVQPDGKIVAAGRVKAGGSPYPQDFAVARYLPTGLLDTSFGSGGKVVLDGGAADEVLIGVGRQSDGKIVVAGTSGGDFFVARYVP